MHWIRETRATLFWSALTAILLSMRHSGFMLLLLTLPLVPWLLFCAWRAAVAPSERKKRLIQILAWTLSIATVVAFHVYWHVTSRAYAQTVVDVIEARIQSSGKCPKDLESVGIRTNEVREKLDLASYGCDGDTAHFFYASTYVVFETESYDFARRQWVHSND